MNRALLLTYGRPVLWRGAGDPVPAGTESAVSAITATPTTTGPAVLVLAEERSVFYATAPTYRAITEAFQSARLAGPEATRGNWVGPGPRVTRTATVGERFGTFAAWVYQWPPGTTPTEATVEQLRTSVKNAVDNVSIGWQPVAVLPYNPTANGPLAWWQCASVGTDCASVTQTKDEFPVGTGRLDAQENHTGPTSGQTHPTTLPDAIDGASEQAKTAATWGLGIVAVLGIGYVGVRAYEASRSGRK
jgi:hypothetical protein